MNSDHTAVTDRKKPAMTAEPFTTAARAEADSRAYGNSAGVFCSAFRAGAEWARTHLAAQEPTDAEIQAVMKVARTHYSMPLGVGPSFARAVIDAARNAR